MTTSSLLTRRAAGEAAVAEEVELAEEVVLAVAEEATEVAEDHSEAGAAAQVCVKNR